MSKRTGRMSTLIAGLFLAASCGSDSAANGPTGTESANDRSTTVDTLAEVDAAPSTTQSTSPSTVPPENNIEQWIESVDDAWQQLGADSFALLLVQGDPSSPGWGTLQFEIDFLESSAALTGSLRTALEDPPATMTDAAAEWIDVVDQVVADYETVVVTLGELGLPGDTRIEGIPEPDLANAFEPFPDDLVLQAACFEFAAQAAEAADVIVDCARSGAVDAVDAVGDSSGPLTVGRHDLIAGVHEFEIAERTFSYELFEPMSIVVGEGEIEFMVEEAGFAPFFHVMALGAVIEPSLITEAGPESGFALGQTITLESLDEWFQQLDFEIERGISVIDGREIPYWRLLDIEWDGGDVPMYGWAESSINPRHLITPGSVFWQVPHPDGALVVYANRVVEAPDDVGSEERLTIGEAFLESLSLPA